MLLALAGAASLLAAEPRALASATGRPAPDFYGVNAQAVFSLPPDQWDGQLSAIRAAGITVVRRDASWDYAEPDPPDPATGAHRYRWDEFDQQVTALARHGLRWYPIVDYSAPWAASSPGDPFSPPAHDAGYAAYAGALAQRYGRGGAFWREHPDVPALPVTSYEIWNEPNFDRFWRPQAGAAARYADLYLNARAALKLVDPQALVVVGGLVDWDGQAFIRDMYRARPDLRGRVDAVGYHPYHLTAARVEGSIAELRAALDRLGQRSVPIEVTEVGLAATSPYVESLRARLLSQLAAELPSAGLGITRLIPHTWVSMPGDAPWGIFNSDGTPRPSEVALALAIRQLRGLVPGAAHARVGATHPPAGRSAARVRVACRGNAGSCRGRIFLKGRVRSSARPRLATIACARFALRPGAAVVVSLRVHPPAQRRLRRVHRLRALARGPGRC